MEKSKVDNFLAIMAEKFPGEKLPLIKEQLEKMDDDKYLAFQTTQFKDPTTMLLISLFAGALGIDRIVLGDTTMGVLKLLTLGGFGGWVIIDLFQIQERTRQWNFRKFMMLVDPTSPLAFMK